MKMSDYIRRWDSQNRKWIYEHREVMEKHLGRKLKPNEHVHHIDGNPRNNAIDNLMLVSASEHAKIHKPALKRHSNKICSIPGCNNPHHAKGLCKKHYRMKYPERYYSKAESRWQRRRWGF